MLFHHKLAPCSGAPIMELILCLALVLTLPACSSAFFVDQGHIDEVDGVRFAIEPPYLFVKKAFKLRGENLSTSQLETLREALPHIAFFTHQIINAENPKHALDLQRQGVRSIRRFQHLNPNTPLYVKTLQHWQIHSHSIEFSTDYFYFENQSPAVTFRDNYQFVKTRTGWQFSGHPKGQADGVLTCTQTSAGWMRCEK